MIEELSKKHKRFFEVRSRGITHHQSDTSNIKSSFKFYRCDFWLREFLIQYDIFTSMITEDKKYISSVLKNLGFAFLTPLGSVTFQYLVLKKSFFSGHTALCSLASFVGW